MSSVTNILLITGVGEQAAIDALNLWARSVADARPFTPVDERVAGEMIGWCAGDKKMECDVYPGAFNYLDLDDLLTAIRGIPWRYPPGVQLFVRGAHDDRFSEVHLGKLPWRR